MKHTNNRQGEKISANLKRPIQCYFVIEESEFDKPAIHVYQDFYACHKKKAPTRVTAAGGKRLKMVD